MKKWILSVIQRVGDLVIKALAYKVLAAAIVTGVYLVSVVPVAAAAPALALGGFTIVAFMWALTVSYRHAESLERMVRGINRPSS